MIGRMTENYYRILGLDNFADTGEIKAAYRRLAKKYHPDRNTGDDEQFKRINEAYHCLIDDEKRALLDEWLRMPSYRPTPDNGRRYGRRYKRPQYAGRPFYYTYKKPTYSRKAKLYAALFTLAFAALCTLLPIGLMYKASDYAYEEALVYYRNHRMAEAVSSLGRAITFFGQRSGEACILGARIALYHYRNAAQAALFVKKGLKYGRDRQLRGELNYLRSKVLRVENKPDSALAALADASGFGYREDSIIYEKALIYVFYKGEFELAEGLFGRFLSEHSNHDDALFGKALSIQKQNRPLESIEVYDRLLGSNDRHAPGLFYRGHNRIVLGDTLGACQDFSAAHRLGYRAASVYLKLQCDRK